MTLLTAACAASGIRAQARIAESQPIRPMRIEVGFTKTVHILFPSPVTYIDIGSMDIIAGKADGASQGFHDGNEPHDHNRRRRILHLRCQLCREPGHIDRGDRSSGNSGSSGSGAGRGPRAVAGGRQREAGNRKTHTG